MGFGGTFLLARWGERLDDVPVVSADGEDPELVDEEPGTGWQLVQVSDGTDLGAELVAYTGGPVLVVYVNDSDCATVQARTADGVAWSGALDAESAAGYESPFGWETDLSVVIPAAVAWAAATGHDADAAMLEEVFTAEAHAFVEDLVYGLVKALGFRLAGGVDLFRGDWATQDRAKLEEDAAFWRRFRTDDRTTGPTPSG